MFAGDALDGLLYRIVERCPPTLDDFCSYEVLGRSYNRRAISIVRRFGHGRGVATLELRTVPIVWARTGASGHVTVWAPPELLLGAVVQCDQHE